MDISSIRSSWVKLFNLNQHDNHLLWSTSSLLSSPGVSDSCGESHRFLLHQLTVSVLQLARNVVSLEICSCKDMFYATLDDTHPCADSWLVDTRSRDTMLASDWSMSHVSPPVSGSMRDQIVAMINLCKNTTNNPPQPSLPHYSQIKTHVTRKQQFYC